MTNPGQWSLTSRARGVPIADIRTPAAHKPDAPRPACGLEAFEPCGRRISPLAGEEFASDLVDLACRTAPHERIARDAGKPVAGLLASLVLLSPPEEARPHAYPHQRREDQSQHPRNGARSPVVRLVARVVQTKLQVKGGGDAAVDSSDVPLGLPGFSFDDLHAPERLAALYERFCEGVRTDAPAFWSEWNAYRQAPDRPPTPPELSRLFVTMAHHVSRFVAHLFRVEIEDGEIAASTRRCNA